MIGRQGEGDSGLEIVLVFPVWAGLGTIAFFPAQKYRYIPSSLRRAAAASQRPEPARAPGFCQGRGGFDSWGGRRSRVASMLLGDGDPSHRSLGFRLWAAEGGAYPLRGRTDGGELLGKTVDERTHGGGAW